MKVLHPLDYIVVVFYFGIVVFIGLYFGKFIKQAKDYFAAGAAVPWWLAGVSLWMASFSAMTFVIYSQLAYKFGLVAITLCWVVIPAMIAAVLWFASRWRRTRIITPLGFIEQRYSRNIHQLFVWTGLPLRMVDNALRVFSTAVFLAVAVGQSWFTLETCIIVVGIIMILYTLLGGQWAVLVTDFFQAIILVFAVVILVPLSLAAVGGVGSFVSRAPEGFFRLFAPSYGLFDWIMFAIMITISYNASWGLVQKYNCVQTEKDAKRVAIVMGILSIIGPILFFIPAMVARVVLPELLERPGGAAEAYVAMSLRVLPIGVMGLMIAGMFSATLSTLGNEYNVLSGILTKDFYGRVIRPAATEKQILFWGKINTAIIGSLTIIFAIGINYIRGFNLWDIMVKAFGAFGPAIMLPLLAGLFVKKVNSRGALFGIVVGMISGVTLVVLNTILLGVYAEQVKTDAQLSYWLKQGFNSVSIGVNILVTLIAMLIGSLVGKASDEERARIETFFTRMDVPSDTASAAETTRKEQRSPFMAVGIALFIYGPVFLVIGLIVGDGGMVIDIITGLAMMAVGLGLWLPNRARGAA